MPTIANLNVKPDGSFEGTLATLNVTAPIAIVPNGRKTKENEPDYRIISRKKWLRTRCRLDPHLAEQRRRICVGDDVGPRIRNDLRQCRQRPRRRPHEEGHHLESAGLTVPRLRLRAEPIDLIDVKAVLWAAFCISCADECRFPRPRTRLSETRNRG